MKRKLVALVIVAFGLWPLVHIALTMQQGLDPWRLGGWAMYSAPGAMRSVRLASLSRDGRYEVLDLDAIRPTEVAALARFRHRRSALGALEKPDDLVSLLLELNPGWDGVWVGIVSLRLSQESATLEAATEQLVRWRGGHGPEIELPQNVFFRTLPPGV